MRIADYDFTPSFLPSVAFVGMLAILMGLGTWQLNRANTKKDLILERLSRNTESMINLNQEAVLSEDARFRTAQAKGRFESTRQWLLDNQVFEGQVGYHVFALFIVKETKDRYLLVDRGWVPLGESRDFLPDIPLPDGEVLLTGQLDTPPSVGIAMGEANYESIARAVVVPRLRMAEFSAAIGKKLLPFSLVLEADAPGVLQPDWAPVEAVSPEKHVGYAVQWFALAIALIIIYLGVNTRRAGRG